jgi:hypothetical protein
LRLANRVGAVLVRILLRSLQLAVAGMARFALSEDKSPVEKKPVLEFSLLPALYSIGTEVVFMIQCSEELINFLVSLIFYIKVKASAHNLLCCRLLTTLGGQVSIINLSITTYIYAC